MLMRSKYQSIKRIVLILSSFFVVLAANAQENNPADSIRILSHDLDQMTDTADEAPPDEVKVEEGYQDSPVIKKSIYFLDKELQVNGGGPDSLQIRNLPDTVIKKLQSADEFWYVNYPFKKIKTQEEEKQEETSFADSTFFQTILWFVIIGGFAAFVIIYLANSNVGLFRKAGKKMITDEEENVETDNIFEINYQREIDKAISNSNYRFAVRLMFLRVLKNLADKKVIQYKHDRTNFDYLMQLHSTRYYNDFFRLTRNYEYSWYGQFDIEPAKFFIIKNDFESFDHNLNHR